MAARAQLMCVTGPLLRGGTCFEVLQPLSRAARTLPALTWKRPGRTCPGHGPAVPESLGHRSSPRNTSPKHPTCSLSSGEQRRPQEQRAGCVSGRAGLWGQWARQTPTLGPATNQLGEGPWPRAGGAWFGFHSGAGSHWGRVPCRLEAQTLARAGAPAKASKTERGSPALCF